MIELITKHKGAFIGGLAGLIIAILMLIIGFWKAMLVLIFIGIGVLIGMTIDGNSIIKNGMDKFKK
ncbi:MAG: DUF2273 domain-containing protein [Eubacteriales bacterium]